MRDESLTVLELVEEVAADVVELWAERSRIPLGPVGDRQPEVRRPDRDHDALDEIAPSDYVHLLAGVEVPHHGMICCPLPGHEDRTPSFKVYPEPGLGWFCFGCGRGGDIYTFGAELWNVSTRGASFHSLRRLLARELLRRSGT